MVRLTHHLLPRYRYTLPFLLCYDRVVDLVIQTRLSMVFVDTPVSPAGAGDTGLATTNGYIVFERKQIIFDVPYGYRNISV